MKTGSSFLCGALFSLALALGASQVFSQNSITIVGPPNGTRITDCETGQLIGGGYTAAIFWAPGWTTDRDAFLQLGGTMGIVNGQLAGGSRAVLAPPGEPIELFAAAWETSAGSSYQQASQVSGAKVGVSSIVSAAVNGAPVRFPDFQVCPVPEPSTWSIVGLALVSLTFRCVRGRKD